MEELLLVIAMFISNVALSAGVAGATFKYFLDRKLKNFEAELKMAVDRAERRFSYLFDRRRKLEEKLIETAIDVKYAVRFLPELVVLKDGYPSLDNGHYEKAIEKAREFELHYQRNVAYLDAGLVNQCSKILETLIIAFKMYGPYAGQGSSEFAGVIGAGGMITDEEFGKLQKALRRDYFILAREIEGLVEIVRRNVDSA